MPEVICIGGMGGKAFYIHARIPNWGLPPAEWSVEKVGR